MKLFHLSCLVPASSLHESMRFLETKKAYNLEIKTFAEEPATRKKSNGTGKGTGVKYDPPNRDLVLAFIKEKGEANGAELDKHLISQGRGKGASGVLAALLKAKQVKRGSKKGLYALAAAPKAAQKETGK